MPVAIDYKDPRYAESAGELLGRHRWKLPIRVFDPAEDLHVAISQAGEAAAAGRQLAKLRQERSRVTVTIARRELRKWLRTSPEGRTVEEEVGRLLGWRSG